MNLFPNIRSAYSNDHRNARDAQRLAEFIAFGPVVFQVSRIMLKHGILEMLRQEEMTVEEIASKTRLSEYAVKVLLEASLSSGTVIINPDTNRYGISKVGWFLLNDPATRVNIDFVHDCNYKGLFHMEEALEQGRPAGLKVFGDWPTIYEGLSSLPEEAKKSWLAFDHFYSDSSFEKALSLVFSLKPRHIVDVGGNTGRWAQRCVEYDPTVEVTVVDLPRQLAMMQKELDGKQGADRVHALPMNMLDPAARFPASLDPDVIWMSQFLDCFSEREILSILSRTVETMQAKTRLCIKETFWDRQRFEPASFCLTMTSLYFAVMANGNSKMYHSDDMCRLLDRAGLQVEAAYDGIGQGHTILVCKRKQKTPTK